LEEAKSAGRVAIMWSVNPFGNYGPGRERVGSVRAHRKHLDEYGRVYWRLLFKVGEDTLKGFPFPMSAYIYDTETKRVEHRARVVQMTSMPKLRVAEYIPEWRRGERSGVFILLDQLEDLHPTRAISEFHYYTNDRPVERPPIGNYLKVIDPLF